MSSTPEALTIQRIKKTPLVIVGIVLELLRIHFGQQSVRFPWNPDPEATGLILEPIDQMDFEVCQKRPAIYVARGPIVYQRIAIDDLHINNPREGEKTFSKLASCTVSCLPLSKRAGEVELLAEEVAEVLNIFTSQIKQDFNFTRFNIGSIQPPGVVQENTEFFTTPTNVLLEWDETWTIKQFSPKLKTIRLNLIERVCQIAAGEPYSCDSEFGKGSFG
jgi:hypothetical protein